MKTTSISRWLRAGTAMLPAVLLVTVASAQISTLSADDRTSIDAVLAAETGFGTFCDGVLLPGSPRTALISVDYTGRGFCHHVLRIRLTGTPTVLQSFESYAVDNVASIVRSNPQSGQVEIVLPRPISDNEGAARCVAVVPSVLRCNGLSCTDTGGEDVQFFLDQVDQREQALARLTGSDEELASGKRECLTIERDKLLRMSGNNPRAGIAQADEWLESRDPLLRRKALSVYEDVGDEESKRKLRRLANDPDPGVRALAEVSLHAAGVEK